MLVRVFIFILKLLYSFNLVVQFIPEISQSLHVGLDYKIDPSLVVCQVSMLEKGKEKAVDNINVTSSNYEK